MTGCMLNGNIPSPEPVTGVHTLTITQFHAQPPTITNNTQLIRLHRVQNLKNHTHTHHITSHIYQLINVSTECDTQYFLLLSYRV